MNKKKEEKKADDVLKKYEELRLKATLISYDHGKTWFVSKQFYLADESGNFIEDIPLEGMTLKEVEE